MRARRVPDQAPRILLCSRLVADDHLVGAAERVAGRDDSECPSSPVLTELQRLGYGVVMSAREERLLA